MCPVRSVTYVSGRSQQVAILASGGTCLRASGRQPVGERLFEQIVRQCVEVGLVQGKNLSVDGSFVEANAAKESRIPREQLAEAAQVHQTVRQYLKEVEEQNPVEEPAHEQDQVSTTDPDSTYATKGGTPARLGY
jgi:hypothetical protein